jgi:hypothetical protein
MQIVLSIGYVTFSTIANAQLNREKESVQTVLYMTYFNYIMPMFETLTYVVYCDLSVLEMVRHCGAKFTASYSRNKSQFFRDFIHSIAVFICWTFWWIAIPSRKSAADNTKE